MKRRQRIGISVTVTLLLFMGISWSAVRAVRQHLLNRQLITAIKQNKLDHSRIAEVRACLQRGADPNTCDEPDQDSLSWNRLQIVLGWRKAPAIPQQTALLLALEGDLKSASDFDSDDVDPRIVTTLLQYGADVRAKDRYGRTPLVAAFSPYPSIVLERGGRDNPPNLECELLLIAAGSDVEARDEEGYSALMSGSKGRDHFLETALLRKGADVNAGSKEGFTALICCARGDDERGCRFLLEHGADVNCISETGSTALMYAARNGNQSLVDLLLQYGANVNANSGIGRGSMPLMFAATRTYCAIMRTLLQHGANIEAKDELGWTALIWAARYGREASVRLLLERGASVTIKDKEGETLSQLVKESGSAADSTIMRLLKVHGMKE